MGTHFLYSALSRRGRSRCDGSPAGRQSPTAVLSPIKLAYSPSRPDGWLELTASAFNRLGQYTSSPGHRAYCCTELAVSSLAMAVTTASTHFTIPQRVEGWVDLAWLYYSTLIVVLYFTCYFSTFSACLKIFFWFLFNRCCLLQTCCTYKWQRWLSGYCREAQKIIQHSRTFTILLVCESVSFLQYYLKI